MATPIYDDEKTEAEQLRALEKSFHGESATTSGSDIAARNKEVDELNAAYDAPSATESGSAKLADAKELKTKEAEVGEDAGALSSDGQLGRGYTGRKKPIQAKTKGGWLNRRRSTIIGALLGTSVIGVAAGGFFGFLNVFNIDNYMNSIESKAFVRYQVDMDGRSSKWITTYIGLRLADVESPDGKMRDNLYFRSSRVDNNQPLKDWYRTLRTSNFERDVFNKNGIRFTSVATRNPTTGVMEFRAAKLTFDADPASDRTFQLTQAEKNVVLSDGFLDGTKIQNPDRFLNNVSSEVFDNDRAARKAIKEAVDKEISPWKWLKRRQIRKDIMNMTGVRKWRFFEGTRNKATANLIEMKNKFLLAALPEDTKSGKFMLCLFGVSDCKVSTDPADPANKKITPDPNAPKQGGESRPTGNGDTKIPVDDGTAGNVTEEAIQASARSANSATGQAAEKSAALITREITQQLVKKFNVGTGIIQTVDSLARISKAISDHKLTAFVAAARTAQAIGFYTTLSTARDQIKTGDLNSGEYDAFMEMTDGLGNNEIWSTVDSPSGTSSSNVAYAASLGDKTSACSAESLAKATNKDYAFLCPQFIIGAQSLATSIENWWNNGIGGALQPVFDAYLNSLGVVWASIGGIADKILAPLLAPLQGLLKVIGLDQTIQSALAAAGTQVASGLGAGPMSENVTGPQIGQFAAEGAAATNEGSMRYQGAALTTATTRASAEKEVAAYLNEQKSSQSFMYRYASLENPSSLLSRQLFALKESDAFSNPGKLLSSFFGALIHLPSTLTSSVSAASPTNTGYEIADMAQIKTYDFPAACNADPLTMTPQSATNADELGLIPANELTWDLVNNKDAFYARLYQSNPDTAVADTVYDCAILDTSVRGAIGAQYGYQDDNSIYSQQNTASQTPATGVNDLTNKTYLQSSSVGDSCAAGTTDLGAHDGYVQGKVVKITLCAVSGLPSTDAESNPSSPYYIQGANGLAIVNARASKNVKQMVDAMIAAGLNISATSTFRSNERQTQLFYSLGPKIAAPPGTSNHQMGYAIDFRISPGDQGANKKCVFVGGVCTPPSDPYGLYKWLTANAATYQYKQYNAEFWHWEAVGVSSS